MSERNKYKRLNKRSKIHKVLDGTEFQDLMNQKSEFFKDGKNLRKE